MKKNVIFIFFSNLQDTENYGKTGAKPHLSVPFISFFFDVIQLVFRINASSL